MSARTRRTLGWRDVLATSVAPKTRAYRARWVLALHEAAQLGRPATWEEWNRIWFGLERVTFFAAERALVRLKAELRQFGVRLRGNPDEEIHAGASDVRALVAPWVLRAREIEEKIAARNEGRTPELASARREAKRIRAADLVEAAGEEASDSETKGKNSGARPSYHWLRARFGIGYERLSYLLACKGAARSSTRRLRIEDQRSAALVERVLADFDRGGTVLSVSLALECSTKTASLFLQRHGRKIGRRGRPARSRSALATAVAAS